MTQPFPDSPPGIAVFGSSEPQAGEPLYELARQLGRFLAEAGFLVVSGGYGGVMEGASRGAREAGGQALGITTDSFAGRGAANRFLTQEIREPDLLLRTRALIHHPQGFVVLPGRSGTLAELTGLWAMHRAGLLERRPVVLLGQAWEGLLESLEGRGLLHPERRQITRLAASPREAVDLVTLALESWDDFFVRGEPG
jgi:uncharacterized protein (TIGR00730 family)